MTVLIISSLVVIVFSFFCSLSEATLLSVNKVKLESDKNKGLSYAITLSGMINNINRPIAAILILNTVAHTGGATYAGSAFSKLYGEEWMWLFSTVFTIIILFGTEILPKVIGVTYTDRLSKQMAHPLHFTIKALYPLVVVTEFVSKLITGKKKEKTSYSLEDIRTIARVAQFENIIDTHQEKIIVQTSALKKRTVKEIMLPVSKVIFLRESIKADEYFAVAEKHLHTRYPVSKTDSPQDFAGYLNLKEIALQRDEVLKGGLTRFIRPLLYINETMSLAVLLKQFSSLSNHLAIVKNDKGENIGMITLEDVVEEVVGDIQDEFDAE